MSWALRSEMPSRASSSSRQNVPSTSTRSLAAKRASTPSSSAGQRGRVGEHARRSRCRGPRARSPRRRRSRTARRPGSTRRSSTARPGSSVRHSTPQKRSSMRTIVSPSACCDAGGRRRRAPAHPTPAGAAGPAVWSISASVRSTPATGGARTRVDVVGRERLELLTRVRRGVDEEPWPLVAADRERRLRAGSRANACARGLARPAVAVPLRKPSAGGRAKNADAHVARRQTVTGGTGRR